MPAAPAPAAVAVRLHHVAFAHGQGGATAAALADLLGVAVAHTEGGPGFVERTAPVGDSSVQLLEATGEGVVDRFVQRRGAALHHVAFEVPDVGAAVAELVARGVRMVDEEPRPGGGGTRIAFVHPEAFGGLLVELVEDPAGAGTGGQP